MSVGDKAANHPGQDDSVLSREARSTWARLIKKIFEADPLLCSCGARADQIEGILESLKSVRKTDVVIAESLGGGATIASALSAPTGLPLTL